jgi:hypothetical protein
VVILSQVIVTKDSLSDKRQKTRLQERQITVDGGLKKWQRSLIKKRNPFTVFVGLAVTPVVVIWGGFVACIFIVFQVLQAIFWGLGKLVGGNRSLVTGRKVKTL